LEAVTGGYAEFSGYFLAGWDMIEHPFEKESDCPVK
jgi:hypothetical protein